ncbi:MAG: MarR family transcriptional regulator [Chloroflexota bacterium]
MTEKTLVEPLGYQLVQVCKAHRNKAVSLLAPIGLHPGQELILSHLGNEDGQTQSELVDLSCVQPATMTKSLDRLANAGLVQRRSDSEDSRVSRIYLTVKGRSIQQKIEQVWQEMEAISFGALTDEERATLRRLLLKVRENLTR